MAFAPIGDCARLVIGPAGEKVTLDLGTAGPFESLSDVL
jgi:hypothetical protein